MLYENLVHVSSCRPLPGGSPAQHDLTVAAEQAARARKVVVVQGRRGSGKTNTVMTLSRWNHEKSAGVNIREVFAAHDTSGEESCRVAEDAIVAMLDGKDFAIVDDLFRHTLDADGEPCSPSDIIALVQRALGRAGPDKGLVLAVDDSELPDNIVFPDAMDVVRLRIPAFGPADYRWVFRICFGEDKIGGVDFDLLHRLAPDLTAFHLNMIAGYLHIQGVSEPTTPEVIEMLGKQLLSPDVDMREVNAILATNKVTFNCS